MNILDHIKSRRTIRNFKSDPIPQPVLDEIFEAAMWAPSPANSQPWDFYVVGPEARGKILPLLQAKAKEFYADPNLPEPKRRALEALSEDFGGAPYMVAVVSRVGHEPMEQIEYPLSAAAAVQNLCLAASAHDVGSIWLSVGAAPPVRQFLGIEEGASMVALLALGYPEVIPPALPRDDYRTHMKQVP
ncbi:nitroreductase family protein [bacterium]|nr:nitroreductase family protein [bacterium]